MKDVNWERHSLSTEWNSEEKNSQTDEREASVPIISTSAKEAEKMSQRSAPSLNNWDLASGKPEWTDSAETVRTAVGRRLETCKSGLCNLMFSLGLSPLLEEDFDSHSKKLGSEISLVSAV